MAVYAGVLKHVFEGLPGRSADGSVLKHSHLSQTLPQLMDKNSEYLRDTYGHCGGQSFPSNTTYLNTLQKQQRTIWYKGTQISIRVNDLMPTFNHIQIEGNSKTVVLYASKVFS